MRFPLFVITPKWNRLTPQKILLLFPALLAGIYRSSHGWRLFHLPHQPAFLIRTLLRFSAHCFSGCFPTPPPRRSCSCSSSPASQHIFLNTRCSACSPGVPLGDLPGRQFEHVGSLSLRCSSFFTRFLTNTIRALSRREQLQSRIVWWTSVAE